MKTQQRYLRIIVDDGGCSGFQYSFKMVAPSEFDSTKDYLFSDTVEEQVVCIIIDSITMDFINGSTVDFKQEMIRSSFEIKDNP